MLTRVNPKRRGQSLVAPIAVINANQELGLLVGRNSKYAKILKLRSGPLQLWTVPIESFDADWRASSHPIQIDIQRFLTHSEKYGADRAAMEELASVQVSLETSSDFPHGECRKIAR